MYMYVENLQLSLCSPSSTISKLSVCLFCSLIIFWGSGAKIYPLLSSVYIIFLHFKKIVNHLPLNVKMGSTLPLCPCISQLRLPCQKSQNNIFRIILIFQLERPLKIDFFNFFLMDEK